MPEIFSSETFKYDVAFSFCEEDHHHALKLNDLIRERIGNTFIYSERQRELAGKDGTQTFANVFSKEARVVVILYREKWGKSGMTNVEMQAIHERAFDTNSDFILIVNIGPGRPEWYSKMHIRYNLEKYGLADAAAAIVLLVQEYGGRVDAESAESAALRYAREEKMMLDLKQYLNSPLGSSQGNEEALRLSKALVSRIEAFNGQNSAYHLRTEVSDRGTDQLTYCMADGLLLLCDWHRPHSNTLNDSYLNIEVSDLPKHSDSSFPSDRIKAKTYSEVEYRFTRNYANLVGWSVVKDESSFSTSEELIDKWLKLMVDCIRDKREVERVKRR